MIPTATRDLYRVGEFYNEDGTTWHSCDRCGIRHSTRSDRPQALCEDCKYLAAYEAKAERLMRAVDMHRDGMSTREIAVELGVSRRVIGNWLKAERDVAA